MARTEWAGTESGFMAERKPTAEELFDLGILYSSGECMAMDLVAAHKWFNLAANAGSDGAADYRHDVALELSADQIASAQRDAREWLTSH